MAFTSVLATQEARLSNIVLASITGTLNVSTDNTILATQVADRAGEFGRTASNTLALAQNETTIRVKNLSGSATVVIGQDSLMIKTINRFLLVYPKFPRNRYLPMRIRQTIYKLKRLYGGTITLYRQGDKTVDTRTGEITWTNRLSTLVFRAVILPVKIERIQTQTISMISMDKQFVYGGAYDRGSRWFYIDPRDLPENYEIKMDDWIVYEGKKYEIKQARDNEFDSLWEIFGTELIGVTPEQIHNLSGYNIIDSQQVVSEVVE